MSDLTTMQLRAAKIRVLRDLGMLNQSFIDLSRPDLAMKSREQLGTYLRLGKLQDFQQSWFKWQGALTLLKSGKDPTPMLSAMESDNAVLEKMGAGDANLT